MGKPTGGVVKIDPEDIKLENLTSTTDLSTFDCGDADLNDFIKNDALPNQNAFFSKTRVAYYQGKSKLISNSGRLYSGEVLGFISLITDNIDKNLAGEVSKEAYRYRYYPALKIARLGTHCDYKRKGIGTALLDEAMLSALSIYKQSHSGCRLVIVDAKATSEALGFYEGFGFYKALKPVKGRDTIPMCFDYPHYFELL